jgi:predicted GNAT family acetyltransferase
MRRVTGEVVPSPLEMARPSRTFPGSAPVRLLGDADLPGVRDVLRISPVADVFVASRVEAGGLDPWRLGAEMWGHEIDGRLVSVCYAGANLWPVCAGPDSVRHFADRALRQGRRCASIVGESDGVLGLWRHLEPSWGPARDVRPDQPLLALDEPPALEPDPAVRLVRPEELDVLLPACVAMFTEEIGIRPDNGDGGAAYRTRVAELIAAGRSFARIENGRVLFKAEIGAATRTACQVQGVWVDPELRGTGLGTAGTAAVVQLARRYVAPVVSLYVNSFNAPARRAYEKVGFHRIGTFASILF